MKNILILFSLLIIITSCKKQVTEVSSNSKNNQIITSNIVGTWKLDAIDTTYYTHIGTFYMWKTGDIAIYKIFRIDGNSIDSSNGSYTSTIERYNIDGKYLRYTQKTDSIMNTNIHDELYIKRGNMIFYYSRL